MIASPGIDSTCLATDMTDTNRNLDPYDVLQVQRTALPEVVRAAYRALAWKYHPDTGADPGRMVAINDAWHTLGNATRRAAHDRALTAPTQIPVQPPTPRSTDVDASPASENDLAPRSRARESDGTGSTLDFGRYQGWTVGRLVNHDPDYLRWLARTPVGRRLASEIDAALSGRDVDAQRLRPTPAAPRGSFLGGLGARARH
jgi:curved DNA-binding protein CbpA